jgi:hypothetical protein
VKNEKRKTPEPPKWPGRITPSLTLRVPAMAAPAEKLRPQAKRDSDNHPPAAQSNWAGARLWISSAPEAVERAIFQIDARMI